MASALTGFATGFASGFVGEANKRFDEKRKQDAALVEKRMESYDRFLIDFDKKKAARQETANKLSSLRLMMPGASMSVLQAALDSDALNKPEVLDRFLNANITPSTSVSAAGQQAGQVMETGPGFPDITSPSTGLFTPESTITAEQTEAEYRNRTGIDIGSMDLPSLESLMRQDQGSLEFKREPFDFSNIVTEVLSNADRIADPKAALQFTISSALAQGASHEDVEMFLDRFNYDNIGFGDLAGKREEAKTAEEQAIEQAKYEQLVDMVGSDKAFLLSVGVPASTVFKLEQNPNGKWTIRPDEFVDRLTRREIQNSMVSILSPEQGSATFNNFGDFTGFGDPQMDLLINEATDEAVIEYGRLVQRAIQANEALDPSITPVGVARRVIMHKVALLAAITIAERGTGLTALSEGKVGEGGLLPIALEDIGGRIHRRVIESVPESDKEDKDALKIWADNSLPNSDAIIYKTWLDYYASFETSSEPSAPADKPWIDRISDFLEAPSEPSVTIDLD